MKPPQNETTSKFQNSNFLTSTVTSIYIADLYHKIYNITYIWQSSILLGDSPYTLNPYKYVIGQNLERVLDVHHHFMVRKVDRKTKTRSNIAS